MMSVKVIKETNGDEKYAFLIKSSALTHEDQKLL